MTKIIKILAPAKINLCLDVLEKDASGLHKIQTIYQEIPPLTDEISLSNSQDSDFLSISQATSKSVSTSTTQHLQKTLDLLRQNYNLKKFVKIQIIQNIPLCSGLGGHSSQMAALLKGLNQLWQLNLSSSQLLELAAKLGSDVSFFIFGGTALGENFGEKITPLKPIPQGKFNIFPRDFRKIFPNQNLLNSKTAHMYSLLNLQKCGQNILKTQAALDAIEKQDWPKLIANLHNDFETLDLIKKSALLKNSQHLSGSGPSTFKLPDDRNDRTR